jgi:hypothetical protein
MAPPGQPLTARPAVGASRGAPNTSLTGERITLPHTVLGTAGTGPAQPDPGPVPHFLGFNYPLMSVVYRQESTAPRVGRGHARIRGRYTAWGGRKGVQSGSREGHRSGTARDRYGHSGTPSRARLSSPPARIDLAYDRIWDTAGQLDACDGVSVGDSTGSAVVIGASGRRRHRPDPPGPRHRTARRTS